jgi:dipeptidase D
MAESASIESLEPRDVWQFFAGLASVPRPSFKEQRVRAHVKKLVEQKGFKTKEEPVGNLIVEVPATKGHDKAPIIVLQAHLDMVCEKNRGTAHDFDRDPIRLVADQDAEGERIIRADGTTLGADNGMGVAMALAAATNPGVVHGPIELLFTINEEAGMDGAKAVTGKSFRGRRMINLDAEEDDVIYIGCAGGCDVNLTWRFDASGPGGDAICARVNVQGLRGGHSGGDIHENRANANKLLARVLDGLGDSTLRIGDISGGSMRNAIPREAHAVVCGGGDLVKRLDAVARRVQAEAKAESYEEGVRIDVQGILSADAGVLASPEDSVRLLSAMMALPNGVLGMHPKVPNLVQTSNNVSTIETKSNGPLQITIGMLSRSSADSCLQTVKRQIVAAAVLAGASHEYGNEYPGWEPNVDSATLATAQRVYQETFREPPKVAAVHAGLECGIIGKCVGGMDMISVGPRITGAHSPDERVYVDSVAKSWSFLKGILAACAKS